MRNKISSIPMPLQTQILLQAALALTALVTGIVLVILISITVSVPFFLLAILFGFGSLRVYIAAAGGRYLTLIGTVLKVERTAILRRPKALLLEIDGKALRIALRNRHRTPEENGPIRVYVLDTAPIYEWRGLHQLSSYLALDWSGKTE